MIYRFAKPGLSHISAEAGTLRDLKAKIECHYRPGTITYKLDATGEGWAFWNGERLGYIDGVK